MQAADVKSITKDSESLVLMTILQVYTNKPIVN